MGEKHSCKSPRVDRPLDQSIKSIMSGPRGACHVQYVVLFLFTYHLPYLTNQESRVQKDGALKNYSSPQRNHY